MIIPMTVLYSMFYWYVNLRIIMLSTYNYVAVFQYLPLTLISNVGV